MLVPKGKILLPETRQMRQRHQWQPQISGRCPGCVPGLLACAQKVAQHIRPLFRCTHLPVPLLLRQQQHRISYNRRFPAAYPSQVLHAAFLPQGKTIQPGRVFSQLFQELWIQVLAWHTGRIGEFLHRLRYKAQGHGIQCAVIVARAEFIPDLVAAADEAVILGKGVSNGFRGKQAAVVRRFQGKTVIILLPCSQFFFQFFGNLRKGRHRTAAQLFRTEVSNVFQDTLREALFHPASAVGKGQLLCGPSGNILNGPDQGSRLELAAGIAVFIVKRQNSSLHGSSSFPEV